MTRERWRRKSLLYIILFVTILTLIYNLSETSFLKITGLNQRKRFVNVTSRLDLRHYKVKPTLKQQIQRLPGQQTTMSRPNPILHTTHRNWSAQGLKEGTNQRLNIKQGHSTTELTTTNAPVLLPTVNQAFISKQNTSKIKTEVELAEESISNFGLFVRMYFVKRRMYESILVRGLRYFWTIKAPLVAVLDDTKEDKRFGNEIRHKYPFPEICHEKPINSRFYHGNGHSLQQLSMFHAEKCFNKKYVGFVDTDTLFVTMVTPDQLFIDGKPVIIGQYGSASDSWWYRVSKMTELALGKKEVFRCMSYFPVMMKVEHLIEMRNYMAKLHNMDFNSVFQKISGSGVFSQFSIMCNYVWYFHRDEYTFHAQLRPKTGIWNGEYTPPGRHGPNYYKQNVPETMRFPVVRAAIHYRYSYKWSSQDTFRRTLKAGLCFSGAFDLCPQICTLFNRTALDKYTFHFEFNDWTWDKRCIIAQTTHIRNIGKLNTTETKRRILQGCKEVDKLSFRL